MIAKFCLGTGGFTMIPDVIEAKWRCGREGDDVYPVETIRAERPEGCLQNPIIVILNTKSGLRYFDTDGDVFFLNEDGKTIDRI